MTDFLNSRLGRIIVHLLSYGIAAGIIAVLEQMQTLDFGAYQTVASVILGAALDYMRKRFITRT